MYQDNDNTYCRILDCVEELSIRINTMYDICPEVYLRFIQKGEISGAVVPAYRISDMYIELNIPYNYNFKNKKNKTTFICMVVHEYCHYIDALTMSGSERANSIKMYTNSQKYRRADEQRNWTATKRLAKKLGLWNKPFYNAVCECLYTSTLKF